LWIIVGLLWTGATGTKGLCGITRLFAGQGSFEDIVSLLIGIPCLGRWTGSISPWLHLWSNLGTRRSRGSTRLQIGFIGFQSEKIWYVLLGHSMEVTVARHVRPGKTR